MDRDIKDAIDILMRVLDGGDLSHEELYDLAFEADGEVGTALNEAYVKLREVANDRDLRLNDFKRDQSMRLELRDCRDSVVKACDRASDSALREASSNS